MSEDKDDRTEQDHNLAERGALASTKDSRLEYLLKNLELDVNGVIKPDTRHEILEKAKKTMKWKVTIHTSQALKDKVSDLDK